MGNKPIDQDEVVTEETSYQEPGEKITRPILFARAYFHYKSDERALEDAGYKCSTHASKYNTAWRLKNRDDVQKEIKRLQKNLEKQVNYSIAELDESVVNLAKASMSDMVDQDTGEVRPLHELPRALTHAISEYESRTTYDKDGNKVVTRKVKLHNKKEVSELLMRRKNLLKGASDGSEVRVRFSFGKGVQRDEKKGGGK